MERITQFIKNAPFSFAYHKIVVDENNKPIDYIFLDVNDAFEKLTGLKAIDTINKKITDVIPNIKNDHFDWIGFYGDIALNGGEKETEQFSENLNRWYKIQAFSDEKYYFSTIFTDVSEKMLLSETLKVFNEFKYDNIDYDYIALKAKEISGASYVTLNVFEPNGKDFKTMGVAGIKQNFEKATNLLGFEFRGKLWKYDPVREEKIKNHKTNYFKSISHLIGGAIQNKLVDVLISLFGLDSVYVVKSTKDNLMLGDFTLIFGKGKTIQNQLLVESYSDIVGMLLSRINSEKKLNSYLEHSPYGVFVANNEGKYTYVNKDACEITGYSKEELLNLHISDLAFKDDLEIGFKSFSETVNIGSSKVELRFVKKTGEIRYWSVNSMKISENEYIASTMDITEKIENESLIKESTIFQQSLLENISVGILIIDPETRMIEVVNKFATQLIGEKEENIIGKKCHLFVCPAMENCCPICDKGQIVDNSDKILLTANGKELPILKTVKRIVINGKEKLLESFVDISIRKQAEQKLANSLLETETMNRIMTGREERIIDLKKEINDLLKQLGKDIKYKSVEI